MRSLFKKCLPIPLILVVAGCSAVDFGIANYASKNVYSTDLDNIGTKWWIGGEGVYDPAQQEMVHGHVYSHVNSVPVGRDLLRQGVPAYVSSPDPQNDLTTCQKQACSLPADRFLKEAKGIVAASGHDGLVWNVGNEVEAVGSADVSPSVYVGQFDAWVTAIKQADPNAQILAPSLNEWQNTSICYGPSVCPYGDGQQWFSTFVSAYQQAHGAKPPIDILGIHYYIAYGDTSDRLASEIGAFHSDSGYPNAPIWITEAGMLNGSQPLTSAETSFMQNMVRTLAQRGPTVGLAKVFWFNMESAPSGLAPVFDQSGFAPWPLTPTGQALATANTQGKAAAK